MIKTFSFCCNVVFAFPTMSIKTKPHVSKLQSWLGYKSYILSFRPLSHFLFAHVVAPERSTRLPKSSTLLEERSSNARKRGNCCTLASSAGMAPGARLGVAETSPTRGARCRGSGVRGSVALFARAKRRKEKRRSRRCDGGRRVGIARWNSVDSMEEDKGLRSLMKNMEQTLMKSAGIKGAWLSDDYARAVSRSALDEAKVDAQTHSLKKSAGEQYPTSALIFLDLTKVEENLATSIRMTR